MRFTELLESDAVAILKKNDLGGYTVPTHGLYPFQWNWDAGFTALGWLKCDEKRAWEELDYLFMGQWKCGMVPHVIFHQESDQYFPGPEEWGVEHAPQTTAISQPPIIATIMYLLYTEGKDRALAEEGLRRLLPKLITYHHWWFRDRDPENTGMVVSYHPWESGMDNSAAWDEALERVPQVQRPYERRDIGHVDSEQRPHHEQYDRYIYLVDLYKELAFDAKKIYALSPYKVQDISLNSILSRANKDLIKLCKITGDDAEVSFFEQKQVLLDSAIKQTWNEELSVFLSRDCISNTLIKIKTTAGLLPIFSGAVTEAQKKQLIACIQQWADSASYGLASTHNTEVGYDPKRYWRGPSWPFVNWMIASGLDECGEAELSENLRTQASNCVKASGYWEYFHPDTGEGYGGDDFSWTAAMILYWVLSDSPGATS